MVTWKNENTYRIQGLSTDTKPVLEKISNGSIFYEIDTGDYYCFDGENKTWLVITL